MPGSWGQQELPNLHTGNCKITSPATSAYNCIAWAAGNDQEWWSPHPQYYWPPGVPRDNDVTSLIKVYEDLGYTICLSGDLEEDLHKVALFSKQDGAKRIWTHAARQLESGEWTSKLGVCEDISHTVPDAVNGPSYGEIVYFMSRPKTALTP